MGALFRLSKNTLAPAAGTLLLKADAAGQLLQAQELLTAAEAQAVAIAEQAEQAFEQRRQDGYAEGILEGRMEQMEKMMETALQAVEYIENIEQTLVKVVGTAVRRVIGELNDDERIVRIVRTALVSVRSQQRVLIRVAPDDEPALTTSLAAMLKAAPGGVNFLDVVADPRMNRGECMLESELGVVDASLETQMKALERALHGKINSGA